MNEQLVVGTWPGRGWPMNSAEEFAFMEEVRFAAEQDIPAEQTDNIPWTRSDMTALVTAMRCGTSFTVVANVAPGVRAGRVLTAHQQGDEVIKAATKAWSTIVANPTRRTALRVADKLQPVIPIPHGQLEAILDAGCDDADVAQFVVELAAKIDRLYRVVDRMYTTLGENHPNPATPVVLGRKLLDPIGGGLFDDPAFLPRRLGELGITRVNDVVASAELPPYEHP